MAKLGYQGTREAYPSTSFDPVPTGVYQVVITDSEMCETKQKTGWYCKLTWQIVDGQFSGRLIFSQHNTHNPNPDAENIGRRELQDFADAVGLDRFEDSEQLHNKPIWVKVGIEVGTGSYRDKNIIKGVASAPGKQTASLESQQDFEKRLADQGNQGFVTTGAMSAGSIGSSNGGRMPAAHVAAAAGHSQATGARKPAARNTRSNPFAE
jgi:hypothetical protein